MTQIVWIASYPQSGGAWVRSLVANIIYGQTAAATDTPSLIPDIHRSIDGSHLHGDTATFIKTNWMYHEKLPLREDVVAGIYVVRHPLDVIAENLEDHFQRRADDHFGLSEADLAAARQTYIDDYLAKGGAEEWIKRGFGTWHENVSSWIGKGVPFPRLMARYEDLRDKPQEFVEQLCQMTQQQRSPEEIAAAIEAAKFAQEAAKAPPAMALGGATFDPLGFSSQPLDSPGFDVATPATAGFEQSLGAPAPGFETPSPAPAAPAIGTPATATRAPFRDALSEAQIQSGKAQFHDLMEVFGYGA